MTKSLSEWAADGGDAATWPAVGSQQIVDAIDWLFRSFVLPAAGYLITDDQDPYYTSFDIGVTADADVGGLALALMAERLPLLATPPDVQRLKQTLDEYGFAIALERQLPFYQVWMAERAITLVRGLLEKLPKKTLTLEQKKKLAAWLEQPLPSLERQLIRSFLAHHRV